MRTLADNIALDSHWVELVYTRAKLAAHPKTADLAPQVAVLLEGLLPLRAEQHAAWEQEVLAQAEVDVADEALDELVDDFAATLQFQLRDPQSPRWRRYFSDTPSSIRRLSLEPELAATATWPDALDTEPEAELKAFAPRFRAAQAQGTTALAHRLSAGLASATHRLQQIIPFAAAHNATRRELYAELLVRANAEGLPKTWPERFFKRS